MLLAVLLLIAVGAAIWRFLARRRIVSGLVWILPVLVLLSGGAALVAHTFAPASFANLRALLIFLFSFACFLTLLYPISRVILPARQLLTRKSVPPLLRGAAIVVVAFIGMLILLSWCFPDLNLTPVFVTSGVISLVVGLALQDPLTNLVAGLILGMEQPVRIGDWILLGEIEGEVIALTWRAITVRTRENDTVVIPNILVAKESIRNFHRPTVQHLCKIRVGVAYATPCGLVTAALRDAAARVDEVLRSPAPEVYLRDFADSAVVYELRAWIDNYGSSHAIESELRKEIWYAFKRYGITIPFPQRDVNLRQVVEPASVLSARLVVTGGPLRGSMFVLGKRTFVIGRNADCDLVISDQHVSGRHAILEPCEKGYHLKDLGSRHGTLLNGVRVREARLEQGDELRVGPVAMVYEEHAVSKSLALETRCVTANPTGAGKEDGRSEPPASTAVSDA